MAIPFWSICKCGRVRSLERVNQVAGPRSGWMPRARKTGQEWFDIFASPLIHSCRASALFIPILLVAFPSNDWFSSRFSLFLSLRRSLLTMTLKEFVIQTSPVFSNRKINERAWCFNRTIENFLKRWTIFYGKYSNYLDTRYRKYLSRYAFQSFPIERSGLFY